MMKILTAMRRLARRAVTRDDAVAAPKSTTTVTTDAARVDVQVRRFGRVFLVIGRERSIVRPPPIIMVQIGDDPIARGTNANSPGRNPTEELA